MIEGYRNILANKFMRDTNFIIIKDTDDIDDLENQWNLFTSQLTVRQQRLSDDRSIEIWNMTNQEHYEELKNKISSVNGEIEDKSTEEFSTDDFESIIDDKDLNDSFNNTIEQLQESEDSNILKLPIDKKDSIARLYEKESNISMIHGYDVNSTNIDNALSQLEKDYMNFCNQSIELRKKSDDKCREIYGKSNIERYNELKANLLQYQNPKDEIESKFNIEEVGGFVLDVYKERQILIEQEESKNNKHRRFNDTPYFTPQELIDLGVHGNDNYYSKQADNDGLVTKVKIPTWFDSYKDMCMDHIFEDYRKEWVDTINMLYSDYQDIKDSGNEEKILARKQSILDLGWNPEIDFNQENRRKASERVCKKLDETVPKDIFISLDTIPDPGEDYVEEMANKKTHKPVLLIFTQGKTPVISQGIKLVTGSIYSHASISFDPELNEVYSYNMRGENFGFVHENLSSFKDNVISVMAFFAPNKIVKQLQDKVKDFEDNKTTFDLRIFMNKILHIDRKIGKNEYNQVCSTFVDTILRSGGINITKQNIPDPGHLFDSTKTLPNKIIEVFNGIATTYNGKRIKRKIDFLLQREETLAIDEACKDVAHAREFVHKVGELAKEYDANYFIVTDGASGIHNDGNPAVRNAREAQIKWEKENGGDPDEDWSHMFKDKKKQNPIKESVLNEVKQFPVEFDEEGNLIIYKARSNQLSYGDEIHDSVELLESYRNSNNIEGIKYELAKLWFIIDDIEKKIKKNTNKLSNDQYKNILDDRATAINVFKTNLEYLMKLDKDFNFANYYNSTPFSDNGIKVTKNTLKYSAHVLKSLLI